MIDNLTYKGISLGSVETIDIEEVASYEEGGQIRHSELMLSTLWEAIDALTEQKGYAPTIREVGDWMGLQSKSSVHYWLRLGKQAGIVTWEPGCPRTLRCL